MNNHLFILGIVLAFTLMACDNLRIYETNRKLSEKLWVQDSLMHFDFIIDNKNQPYNLLANIQYTNEFQYRNLYISTTLSDSIDQVIDKSLINIQLFTNKLGKPLGSSAIGDIYELQTPIISKHQFPKKGKYRISFQQYMRVDSLYNISRIGLRVEKSTTDQ